MNHTASELIPGWYSKGVNRDVSSDEMGIRRNSINEMAKSDNVAFWLNCLKVYLNNSSFAQPEYTFIVEYAKAGDDNFSIQNENLVRIICGCAIGQKIDEKDSDIAQLLSLALLTTHVIPNANPLIPEIVKRAKYTWEATSEEARSVDTDFNVGTGGLKNANKVAISDITADAATHKPHTDSVIAAISAIQKDIGMTNGEVNLIHKSLEIIKTNFISLSEETDILWWLFGAYSTTAKKPFKLLPPDLLSILIPIELGELTKLLPGIGGVDSIIFRALSNVNYESGSIHSIDSVINSIADYEETLKKALPVFDDSVTILIPFLFAIKCRSEYASNVWKSVYNKKIEIDLESKFTYEFFSLQLYKELMLVYVYKNLID
jgi:GTPase-associated system-like protein